MSRTNKDTKGPGYEYWKSRLKKYKLFEDAGKFIKKLTHRKERRQGKKAEE